MSIKKKILRINKLHDEKDRAEKNYSVTRKKKYKLIALLKQELIDELQTLYSKLNINEN